jgi:hypothetical protein
MIGVRSNAKDIVWAAGGFQGTRNNSMDILEVVNA